MSGVRPSRCHLFGLILGLFVAAGAGGAAPPAAGQEPAVAPDTTAAAREPYHVSSQGPTTLKEIHGEKVLELRDHVRVVHGDIVVTADRGLHYTDRAIAYMIGHVKIVQGTLTMWGDRGEYRRNSELAMLHDNVRIVDRGWHVTCDRVRYSRVTGHAWLVGHVVAQDSATTLTADSLFYDRPRERSEAFGRVQIANKTQGFVANGRHAVYNRARGEGIIDREPRLTVDPDKPQPVVVVSDTMRVYPDSSRALAYYRVKIIKGNTVTQCDSAALYDKRNLAELYGSPRARQGRESMQGTKMTLHYNEEEVRRIDVEGKAEMREHQADSLVVGRDNWIQGDNISLFLHQNRVDSIQVTGSAQSEYHPSTPVRVESNFAQGEKMFFRFERDSLDYVRVTGKASGTYRYLNLLPGQTADSLRAVADTTLKYLPFRDKSQEVDYAASRIEYFATTGNLVLDEDARIRYHNSTLTGKNVTYYSKLQLLDARGEPVLTEDKDKFYGKEMDYDMDGRTGLVTEGSTQFNEGYYTGEHVAKVGENEMKVWHSVYTTCDLAQPHYHFAAKEMKVYPNDKVITGPIVLYVGQTPIAYLPFMAASLRRGRRSGILRPDFEFGFNSNRGRFIRNFGYYWATNDYLDFKVKGDYNEDSSFGLYLSNHYALRYRFNGGIDYTFFRDMQVFRNKWIIDANHNQQFGSGARLRADLHFVSDDTAPRSISNLDNVQDVVDRSIRSNVSYTRSFKLFSLSASATRQQYLNITDPTQVRVQTTLPNLSFGLQPINLYRGSGHGGFWQRVFGSARLSPSLSGSRKTTAYQFINKDDIASNQGLGLSASPKLGFLTISPRVSASNATQWSRYQEHAHSETRITGIPPDTTTVLVPDSLSTVTKNTFSWNTGASMSTNFYGTFYPHVGRLRGIRHTISPSVSYTLTPSTGNQGPRRQSIGVSLRQALDLKIAAPRPEAESSSGGGTASVRGDSTATPGGQEQVQKLSGVVIWTLSSSYNPQAPERRGWSRVNSNVNTTIYGTNVSLNQTFDPYTFQVQNTSVTSGVQLSGTHPFGKSSNVQVQELNVVAKADTTKKKEQGGVSIEETGSHRERGAGKLGVEEGRLPWSVSADISYNKGLVGPARSTLRLSGQTSLTDNWNVSYGATYDVETRSLSEQSIQIKRDLHCWQMSFTRVQLADQWEFYFRISVKALPEVYAEQGQRGLRGGNFGIGAFGY